MLIVGLGNPGEEHENTRHNAGRMVLAHFAAKHGFPEWKHDAKANALVSEGAVGGTPATLLLPETFMNNSGLSLKPKTYNLKPDSLIVVHDELDLSLGTLRVSFGRSAAGHRGVQSIIDTLGTKEFTRIRIGISPLDESGEMRKPRGDAAERFVLKPFGTAEQTLLEDAIRAASDALVMLIVEGRQKAMNVFN